MDLIYRKKKYKELLSRLHELNEVNPTNRIEDSLIDSINNRLIELLSSLKGKGDLIFVRNAYCLLTIPLMFLLIYWSYQSRGFVAYVLIALILIFFAICHLTMKGLIKRNKDWAKPVEDEQDGSLVYTWHKINYIGSIIDLKGYRYILLAMFYIAFYPALLYYLYSLTFGTHPSISIGIMAAVLSIVYWVIYFYEDITFYQKLKIILEEIKNQLTSLSTE